MKHCDTNSPLPPVAIPNKPNSRLQKYRTHPAVKGARLFASFFLEDVRRRELPIAGLFVE